MTYVELQRGYLIQLIVETCGDLTEVARISGWSRSTVYRLIQMHGIDNDLHLARLSAKPKQPRKDTELQ